MSVSNFKIWEGIFKDYKTAINNNFNNKEYSKIYIKKALKVYKTNIELLKKNKINKASIERFIHLPMLVKNFSKKNTINIVDFGGGFGNSYLYLKLTLNKELFNKIKYNIIETDDVVFSAKKINKKINFSNKFKSDIKPDIVFICSSLQYIDNWKKLINQICELNPKSILLSDVFCHKNLDFVTHQNYYNFKLIHRFFSLKKINLEFKKNNYILKFSDDVNASRLSNYNYLPMNNFPKKYRIEFTKHLLYEK